MQKSYVTKRLSLRRLNLKDYQAWIASQEKMGPKLNSYDVSALTKSKRTFSHFKKSVARIAQKAKNDETYMWNIFLKDTGELIGFIDVSTISRIPYQMANLGYFIIGFYRRNGYAKEAIIRIIKASFRDLKYHRLEAATDLNNHPSRALALACGMKKEGVKKHYWFQGGRWEDQMTFVITPELLRG